MWAKVLCYTGYTIVIVIVSHTIVKKHDSFCLAVNKQKYLLFNASTHDGLMGCSCGKFVAD